VKTVCVAMSAHHTDSVPAFGTTMANRAPQFNWTHSRNPVSANDMSASWNKELYRCRPSAQLPQAPLAESYGTQWIRTQKLPKIKREFKNWYLPNYCDLATTPVKNYHPRLTGYEELQRTCYPGRGKDYVRENLAWALSTNPRGAFWEGTRRPPLRLEPGDAPYLGQMPVYDEPVRNPGAPVLHRAISDGGIFTGGSEELPLFNP